MTPRPFPGDIRTEISTAPTGQARSDYVFVIFVFVLVCSKM